MQFASYFSDRLVQHTFDETFDGHQCEPFFFWRFMAAAAKKTRKMVWTQNSRHNSGITSSAEGCELAFLEKLFKEQKLNQAFNGISSLSLVIGKWKGLFVQSQEEEKEEEVLVFPEHNGGKGGGVLSQLAAWDSLWQPACGSRFPTWRLGPRNVAVKSNSLCPGDGAGSRINPLIARSVNGSCGSTNQHCHSFATVEELRLEINVAYRRKDDWGIN